MFEDMRADVKYVVFRQTAPGWNIPMRTIGNHELVLAMSGGGTVVIEDRRHEVQKGDLYYFYPGLRHSLSVSGPAFMSFYAVHFELEGLDGRLALPEWERVAHFDGLAGLFRQLDTAWKRKDFLYTWKQNILLQQILFELYAHRAPQTSPADTHRAARAVAYMHAHPFEPYDLARMCALAGMGKSCFLQAFRALTGSSPLHYYTALKLEHARELLLDTPQSVRYIAHRCGFEDEFYFSRRFKQYYGLSPAAFRRETQGGL